MMCEAAFFNQKSNKSSKKLKNKANRIKEFREQPKK